MLYFNNPGAGECVLLEEVDDLALIYREKSRDYVVAYGLDKKTFSWCQGHYFGSGIAALGRAIEYIIKESCR